MGIGRENGMVMGIPIKELKKQSKKKKMLKYKIE